MKVGNGCLFMSKHLNNLLPIDNFFDKAFNFCRGILLRNKAFCGFSSNSFDHYKHDRSTGIHHEREPNRKVEHRYRQYDQRERSIEDLHHALRQELTDRVNIIGIVRHNIAVLVLIEISDGQRLHLCKHILPQGVQRRLPQLWHDKRVDQRTQDTQTIHAGHGNDQRNQGTCHTRKSICNCWSNDIVYEEIEKHA